MILGGQDFSQFQGQVRLNSSIRRDCFSVMVTDDDLNEEVESFSLVLELDDTVMDQSGIMIEPNRTEIFIIDDDGM